MPTTIAEPFCDTEEAAAFLHKPPSWVYANAGRLRIPRYKVGNHWRYRLSELASWVESHASGSLK
ncbi:helix-turn-helix domain-containing protein [Aeromicrobium marinum]|uniref:helix-turn-helix domain-containing protein n=1 Tax=Aeromicrobium marinum TaxID=219314 RepID=UPI00145D1A06